MNRWLKLALVSLILGGGAIAVPILGRAYLVFSIEDKIHGAFFPLVRAIEHYCEDRGEAPPDLAALLPEYLAEMPSSRFVSEVSFSAASAERRWRLVLASTSTGKRRLYIAERGMPLSDVEKRWKKARYHDTWSVIEPK